MPCAWCRSIKASMNRSGQRSARFQPRSAVRQKPCGAGVREHERDSGQREGPTSAEQQRIKALEREVGELRKANEIPQAFASAFFAAGGARPPLQVVKPSSTSTARPWGRADLQGAADRPVGFIGRYAAEQRDPTRRCAGHGVTRH